MAKTVTNTYNGVTTTYQLDDRGRKIKGSESAQRANTPTAVKTNTAKNSTSYNSGYTNKINNSTYKGTSLADITAAYYDADNPGKGKSPYDRRAVTNTLNNSSLADLPAAYKDSYNPNQGKSPYSQTSNYVSNNSVASEVNNTSKYGDSGYNNVSNSAPDMQKLYDEYLNSLSGSKIKYPEYNGITKGDIEDYYGSILDQLKNSSGKYLDTLYNQFESQKADTNSAYKSQASGNYINYVIGQNALKSQMAAKGVTGGASDSMKAELAMNYATNQNATAENQQKALRDMENSYNTIAAQKESDISTAMASIQQSMVSAIMQASQAENEYNQWIAEAERARSESDRAMAFNMAQAAADEYYKQIDVAMKQQEYQNQLSQQQYNREQQSLQNAYTAAQYGDFSALKDLGMDTSAMEAAYELERQQAQAEYENANLTNQAKKWSLEQEMNKANTPVLSSYIYSRSKESNNGGDDDGKTGMPPEPDNTGQALANARLNALLNTANQKNMSSEVLDKAINQLVRTGQVTMEQVEAWRNS